MAIVFFIILFLLLTIGILICSTIRIGIDTFVSNINIKDIHYDYTILLELSFLGKLTFLKIILNKEKTKKINQKLQIKKKIHKVNWKSVERTLPIRKMIELLQIELEEFHFYLKIGTENVILTSGIITILSTLLGVILARGIKKYNKEKYEYYILPLYQNRNQINLEFDSKIKFWVVHIIQVAYKLKKRKKENQKAKNWKKKHYRLGYERV